ncbi:sensor histidine kinase [Ammoniphilus sp. YIM 78166]|uniref:cache domain-containing sensor histidine kinase n=1 Tax=Ammoniphilus sp. YIM 78166 TaxID=1644106 RepID=UPI00106F4024|nr:sensor histidine kinase [Ammoniphilus sp. YIM 78166]
MRRLAERLDRWTSQIKLQPKLLITFYFVSFVPLFTTAAFFYFAMTESLEEEVGTSLVLTTRQVDERLSSFVEETTHLAKILHFDPNVQELLGWEDPSDLSVIPSLQELRRSLEPIVYHRAHLRSIYVINDYGRYIYSGKNMGKLDYDFEGDPWYKEVVKDKDFRLLAVHPQQYVLGAPVVSFAGRLYHNLDFKQRGTLLFDFDPEYFSSMIDSIRVGKTGSFFMVSPEGQPVIQMEEKNHGLIEQLMKLSILEKKNGYLLTQIEGVQTLVGFSTSRTTGWKIIGVVPFQEVSGKIEAVRYGVVIFSLIATLFILLFSKYLSRAITRPMFQLQRYMGRVEKGDFSTRVPTDRGDEFGMLTNRFNHMLERLQQLKEEVYLAEIRETKLQLLNRETELKALQMQINPHFLYNTLNTMKCVGEVYDVKEVSEMSEGLAEMFRYSIDSDKYKLLSEELDHVKAYLQIIQVRYPERIQCHFDIPQDLKGVSVLKLILQPLVENAIEHGLIPKSEQGGIWISAKRTKDGMSLLVRDNGVGIPEHRLMEIKQKLSGEAGDEDQNLLSGHIGLHNVQQRLLLNYGSNGKLTVESDQVQGTRVEIHIPLDKESEGDYRV